MLLTKRLARIIEGRELDLKTLLSGLLWYSNFSITLLSLFSSFFTGYKAEMFKSLSMMTRIMRYRGFSARKWNHLKT